MSSGISNKVKPTGPAAGRAVTGSTPRLAAGPDAGLPPWQFFVLAGLGCATAAVFVIRGQGLTAVILSTILMGATALAGFAALRTLRPLVSADEERTPMAGRRTRTALEREKMLALRAIKELEFDKAMGKLSEADWLDMSGRLRARASRLMRQLDAGAGYRDQIERDLARRLDSAGVPTPASHPGAIASSAAASQSCSACATLNDVDACFCKSCGHKL
jgi:hypothetical protein